MGEKKAFVLRIAPGGVDQVPEALESDTLIIGWSTADGLTDKKLSWKEFRQIVHDEFYKDDESFCRSGSAAGNLWRFIWEMEEGDLVVVPHGSGFYVAHVAGGGAYLDKDKIDEDTGHRRSVVWRNEKKPIPRSWARAALQSRMKVQGTSVRADDLVSEIEEVVRLAEIGKKPTFALDLKSGLVDAARHELHSGRVDSYGFERLVKNVLESLGASDARVVPRQKDAGADVVATFRVAEVFQATIAVQAKHFTPEPPVGPSAVKELISGMEAEGADFGMVVTSGTFSEEAKRFAEEVQEERGFQIRLMDGDDLATLTVESGLRAVKGQEQTPDSET
ncbi:MAG: restriction endonuclease [Candidatus Thermoplasmatota archaeon]|nr:restriction endonuclease [Candidatus Thermoplasmatota archaeon]